ncbi:hypothetical protein LRS74_20355 [Streptomyces sp. LX-29]|uniref:hypothetical protein n=1 Tax=Streptomyces sp. LX-29 TaxID=2900152 RepID=UPI00240DBBF2|nr:hypothetical protein [Streptomyces sp. LX-29]WFB09125.1 hypothetical protein LRS74_20355 [Streptomyces sp. LX-29]
MSLNGSDFGIQKGETLSASDRLTRAAGDLDAVTKSLGGGSGGGWDPLGGIAADLFTATQFGEYGAGLSFTSFAGAWNGECATLAGALRELHAKIGTSANAFGTHNKGVADDLRGTRNAYLDGISGDGRR